MPAPSPKMLLAIRIRDQIVADLDGALRLHPPTDPRLTQYITFDEKEALPKSAEAVVEALRATDAASDESTSTATFERYHSSDSLLAGTTSMANLGNLPTELKALIVEKVVETRSDSIKVKKKRHGEMSPLLALCLVNKQFAALSFPFIWR
ncbi:hypothetical protein MNV49_002560, partial [Pseudohyphozyma bogoriensis]